MKSPKLYCRCPETGKHVWFESPTRHDLLAFLAKEYFESGNLTLTGWVLCSGGRLVLLSGSIEIGSLEDAMWED